MVWDIPLFKASEELQAFLRPKAIDVDKSLALLPKLESEEIYSKLVELTEIQHHDRLDSDIKKCSDALNEFSI